MNDYEIIESDYDNGLIIIKLISGKFKGLLLILYNVGCNGVSLFYQFTVLNYKDDIDYCGLDDCIDSIVKKIFFDEVN